MSHQGLWGPLPKRGRDPVGEFSLFCADAIASLALTCEAVLDQRVLNGVGSYVRAEILWQAKGAAVERQVSERAVTRGMCSQGVASTQPRLMHMVRQVR